MHFFAKNQPKFTRIFKSSPLIAPEFAKKVDKISKKVLTLTAKCDILKYS